MPKKATQKKARKTPRVEHGSGNIFADLGLPNPSELLAKSELVSKINAIIRDRRLTQSQAATILGIDQPKISALRNGRLTEFSLRRLMRFSDALKGLFDTAPVPPVAPVDTSWESFTTAQVLYAHTQQIEISNVPFAYQAHIPAVDLIEPTNEPSDSLVLNAFMYTVTNHGTEEFK